MPRRGSAWWEFRGPFGFGLSFGFPGFWWRGPGYPSVEEEIEMLEDYKDYLEKELEQVNRRLRRLKGEGG